MIFTFIIPILQRFLQPVSNISMRKLTLPAFFLIIFSFSLNTGFAQEDTLSTKTLSEIVVTGQYKPQSLKQSVYQVKVVPAEIIRKMGATNLESVLQNQLNLRFQYDAATGGSNFSMAGLAGQSVKVLVDGVPLVGRQGTNNEININQIDVHTIERIEIVEGPMSVIYGADALAGVVNIITKKKSREKFGVGANLQEETVGNEYGAKEGIHNQHINAFLNHKKFYFNGNIGRNLFQGWKDTAQGRELVWHSKRQFVGSAVLGYKSEKLHAYYRFDGLDELITNPANFPSASEPALDQEYISQRTMHQLQASYVINYQLDVNAAASYTHFSRQVYSSLYYPGGDVRAVSTPGLNSITSIHGYNFRASVQYRPFRWLSFQPGIDVNLEDGEGERIKQGVQRIDDYAFYLTAEVKPTSRLNIKPGIRMIENSVYNAPPVIPSLNAKYSITKNLDVRAAYARGFRAPSIRELYYDFVDASHNITGNPNLKAEHSDSYTASLLYTPVVKGVDKFTTVLSGFSNNVKNRIDFLFSNTGSNTTYMNIADFRSRGLNLENTIAIKNLSAGLGAGVTGYYNEYNKEDKSLPEYNWSPEVNARLSYTFNKIGLTANAFYKFTGQLPRYQEFESSAGVGILLLETQSYHWADITVNKKVGRYVLLNAGVKNLFDVSMLNTTQSSSVHGSGNSFSQLAYGRSYFAGLAFNWLKK